MVYLNIQSLPSHLDQLVSDVVCYRPSCILLSEARVTADIEDFELTIPGYSLVRCDSDSRHTGGVVIYVRESLNYGIVKNIAVQKSYWFLMIKLKLYAENLMIACLYRSPGCSASEFIDCCETLFEDIFKDTNKCIIVGDFNLGFRKLNDVNVKKLKNIITNLGVEQLVRSDTRTTQESSSLIDYVLTNRYGVVCDTYDVPKITDHCIITVSANCLTCKEQVVTKTFRNFSQQRLDVLNRQLIDVNWQMNSSNIDVLYDDIHDNVTSCIDTLAPIKLVSVNSGCLPWYDAEVRGLTRDRDRYYRLFRASLGIEQRDLYWNLYKKLRNQVVNLLRYKKSNYYRGKIQSCLNNSKRMWQTLKTLVKPVNGLLPSEIEWCSGQAVTVARTDEQKADMFNNYFIDSILNIGSSVPAAAGWSPLDLPRIDCKFCRFKPLSLSELRGIVKKLNNKCSSDVLNNRVLKSIFGVVGHVMLNFVNTSLETGKFPDKLKVGSVVPIPKVCNPSQVDEFRPVNTLPTLEKILEMSVYSQLCGYVDRSQILMEYQSGFRSRHSCETALQVTISGWKLNVDNNKYTVAVFLDFKRAFETVDVDILIEKLKYYGLSGTVLRWFESYLTGRRQRTRVNGVYSQERDVLTGVPQGSVLGPLLFILYLNDFKYIQDCEFLSLFADDTLLAVSDLSLEGALGKMNVLLQHVSEYLNINKLHLNVQKTKAMIITTKYKYCQIDKESLNLKINNQSIEIVEEIKYLGFIVDNILSLKSQFTYVHKKISKKLFFFSRIRSSFNLDTALLVYKTIVQPHFDYCASLLYLLDAESVLSLQRLQNRAMRIILKCNRYAPIKLMLNTFNWLSVKDRFFYFSMIFIFKIIKGLAPSYFSQFISYNRELHDHFTRRANDFYVTKKKYSKTMNSIFHKGLCEFNMLPVSLVNCNSLREFKPLLFRYLRGSD